MIRFLFILSALLLVGLGSACWQLSNTKTELTSAQRIIGTLSAGIESRDKAIARMNDEAKEGQIREAKLRLMQGRASTSALNRELQMQRETDASEDLRGWSAAVLPDDVIRLHSRPAFSSARDYLDWLSTRDKLPVPVKQPANAGRSGG